uniref:Uncharacterized protein n=1 Tax=Knipowitschia caucasica TaxID=637954 RepID=A0AAV2MK90_KNICA
MTPSQPTTDDTQCALRVVLEIIGACASELPPFFLNAVAIRPIGQLKMLPSVNMGGCWLDVLPERTGSPVHWLLLVHQAPSSSIGYRSSPGSGVRASACGYAPVSVRLHWDQLALKLHCTLSFPPHSVHWRDTAEQKQA